MVRLPGMGFPSLVSQVLQMSWFAVASNTLDNKVG
jgi:hypothetical protein